MGKLPSSGECLALQSRPDRFAEAPGSGRFSRTPPFFVLRALVVWGSVKTTGVHTLLSRPHLSQVQPEVPAPVPSVTGFLQLFFDGRQ